MVLVDGVKYACQACIKGHRSSKCTHTDRELTEIKKKGRPTSQCNHCRELRKTRSVHGKCECIGSREAREQTPVAKVLPNGLIDILKPSEVPSAELNQAAKSGVNLLLNPCNCRNGGSCHCCQSVSKAKTKPFPQSPPSPLFLTPDLPAPSLPAPKPSGGCCSLKRTPPASSDPWQPPRTSSSSGCCSSTRTAPSPPYVPSTRHFDDDDDDIQVSPRLASSTPPPYAVVALSSSNPLFLPQTHGTSSCFCGPTCQCVGCATHDPFALKAKRKRSDSLEEAAGGRGGGGRGGETPEPIGCRCEVGPGDDFAELDDGAKRVRKKKECCSNRSTTTTTTTNTTTTSRDTWPQLAAQDHDENLEWPRLDLSSFQGGGGGRESTPMDPLPSLRTLLPALIDSTSSQPAAGHPIQSEIREPELRRELAVDLDPPSYLVDSHHRDVFEVGDDNDDYDGIAPPPPPPPKIACSSAFVNEIFDGDGHCGEMCMCDTACGCRVDPPEGGEGVEGATSWDKGELRRTEPADGMMREIARLAEMGHFG